ncbi:MAG: Rieske 2Fe-2S domain-containing protein [Bacteroidota bacterium]
MKWVKVFDSPETANSQFADRDTIMVLIGKRELCLVKFNNEYFAVSDLCPHQRESLSKGQITPYGEIVCPLHFYRFNLKTGTECQNRTDDLKRFQVKVDDSGLFIYY